MEPEILLKRRNCRQALVHRIHVFVQKRIKVLLAHA